jgi:LSD1 subclass zinc finger protein
MKVHLVDGTYELFRAYYAVPKSQNSKGAEVAASRGLCRSLLSLLAEGASHVACAFDHVIESFRNDLFDGYKTSEGIEPDLWAQFPLAERATRALGIVTWAMVEFEADDALATAAERFERDDRVSQVVICSPDKDLAQCVKGQRVVTWDRMRGNVLDQAAVKEKFGVEPQTIPDYLGLVGDSADGIPGVPRWGAKSSAAVLAACGSLEKIPNAVEQWPVQPRGAAALCKELNDARQQAALYKRLATLRADVPLSEVLDDLQWRGADRELFAALCEELQDDALAKRVTRFRD